MLYLLNKFLIFAERLDDLKFTFVESEHRFQLKEMKMWSIKSHILFLLFVKLIVKLIDL